MSIEIEPTISLKEAIKARRAARAFRPDPITDVLLAEIFNLGLASPSGYNLQPWRFIVLRDAASKEKLKPAAFNQRQITEAPVVLICCGDTRVATPEYIESVIQLGRGHGAMPDALAEAMRAQIPQMFEYKPCFESVEAWANRHTMLAVAHLLIAAKSLGVDSCPMEGFVAAQIKELFNIPEGVYVCALVCLGYAAEPFKQFGGRFGPQTVCFAESYGQAFSL